MEATQDLDLEISASCKVILVNNCQLILCSYACNARGTVYAMLYGAHGAVRGECDVELENRMMIYISNMTTYAVHAGKQGRGIHIDHLIERYADVVPGVKYIASALRFQLGELFRQSSICRIL